MASRRLARRPLAGSAKRDTAEIDRLVAQYGNQWLANARHHCANAADADDAYQRSLEILLTKRPEAEEHHLVAWMHTVVRNESLNTYRRRRFETDAAFEEISSGWVTDDRQPDERVIESEDDALRLQALRAIKPDQTRCLLLRADGLDYAEICSITGFSYAKVNRLLSEGRTALRIQVGLLESGAECQRLQPILSMIADGEASSEARAEATPHLSNCHYCQATLRDYMTAPDRARIAFPLAVVTLANSQQPDGLLRRALDSLEALWASIQDRVATHAPALAPGAELANAKRAAMALALSASLIGGGAAARHAVLDSQGGRFDGDHAAATSGATSHTFSAGVPRSGTPQREVANRDFQALFSDTAEIIGATAGRSLRSDSSGVDPNEASVPDDGEFNPPPGRTTPSSSVGARSSDSFPDLAP